MKKNMKKNMMRRLLLAPFLIILLILSTGCIDKVDKSVSYRSYIIYNIGKLPENLLFCKDKDRERDLSIALFTGLVKKGNDGSFEPALAESFSESKDGMTFTFKLKSDSLWSTGERITAEDFVDFFSVVLSEDSAYKDNYSENLNFVFGVKDYSEGKKSFKEVGIQALDESTLEFRLNYPSKLLLECLSQPEFALRNAKDNLQNWKDQYKNISFTGPFVISDISSNNEVTLLKNQKYYDVNNVYSEKILFTSIEFNEMSMANFYTEKIDVIVNPPLTELQSLQSENRVKIKDYNNIVGLVFNQNRDYDKKYFFLRELMSKALDKEYLSKTLLQGFAEAYINGNSFFNNEPFNVDTEDKIEAKIEAKVEDKADPKRDKSENETLITQESLKKNVKEVGLDEEKLTLIYEASAQNKKVSDYITKEMKTTYGLNIESKGFSGDDFENVKNNMKYDMLLTKFNFFYNDPEAFLNLWSTFSKNNIWGYKNYNYDKELRSLNHEKLSSKRNLLVKNCEEILKKDSPFIAIYFDKIQLVQSEEIQGIMITERGDINLEKAYLDNRKMIKN